MFNLKTSTNLPIAGLIWSLSIKLYYIIYLSFLNENR